MNIGGQTCTVTILVEEEQGCPTLAIGESFGGGIVIEDDYPGSPCGYLIVREDNDDNSFGVNTDDACLEPETTLPTDIDEGQANTNYLLSICASSVANVCDNSTHAGFDDWFLPSSDEVADLFLNWTGNNYPLGERFHTSTFEFNFGLQFIRRVEPGEDNVISNGANIEGPVRCVRNF